MVNVNFFTEFAKYRLFTINIFLFSYWGLGCTLYSKDRCVLSISALRHYVNE